MVSWSLPLVMMFITQDDTRSKTWQACSPWICSWPGFPKVCDRVNALFSKNWFHVNAEVLLMVVPKTIWSWLNIMEQITRRLGICSQSSSCYEADIIRSSTLSIQKGLTNPKKNRKKNIIRVGQTLAKLLWNPHLDRRWELHDSKPRGTPELKA